MEHNMEHHNTGMNHEMDQHMKSWFHASLGDTVMFNFWQINNVVRSLVLVAVLAFMAEFARFQLWLMERRRAAKSVRGYSTFGIVARDPPKSLWTFGLVYAIQLTLGYMAMLVFMTYSIWLALALCFGGTAGFCYFEHQRRVIKNSSLLR